MHNCVGLCSRNRSFPLFTNFVFTTLCMLSIEWKGRRQPLLTELWLWWKAESLCKTGQGRVAQPGSCVRRWRQQLRPRPLAPDLRFARYDSGGQKVLRLSPPHHFDWHLQTRGEFVEMCWRCDSDPPPAPLPSPISTFLMSCYASSRAHRALTLPRKMLAWHKKHQRGISSTTAHCPFTKTKKSIEWSQRVTFFHETPSFIHTFFFFFYLTPSENNLWAAQVDVVLIFVFRLSHHTLDKSLITKAFLLTSQTTNLVLTCAHCS